RFHRDWSTRCFPKSPHHFPEGSMSRFRSHVGASVVWLLVSCADFSSPKERALTPHQPSRALNPAGTVVVYPGNMHGWVFSNDEDGSDCTRATLFLPVPCALTA